MTEHPDEPGANPSGMSQKGRPVVLITGGSKGIGQSLAEEFARAGHNLFLVARDEVRLEKTAAHLRADFPVQVATAPVDLLDVDRAEKIQKAVQNAGCFVDILVNNAALGLSGPFVETTRQSNLELMTLNITAPTELTHLFLSDMIARKSGGVMNVASLAGLAPVPYLAAYSATKSYMISLTRSLQREVLHCGVHVMAVTPGPVATSFLDSGRARANLMTRLYPRLTPQSVARIALDGFYRERVIVTPGLLNAFVAVGAKLVPHGITARAIAPFTRHTHHQDVGDLK